MMTSGKTVSVCIGGNKTAIRLRFFSDDFLIFSARREGGGREGGWKKKAKAMEKS